MVKSNLKIASWDVCVLFWSEMCQKFFLSLLISIFERWNSFSQVHTWHKNDEISIFLCKHLLNDIFFLFLKSWLFWHLKKYLGKINCLHHIIRVSIILEERQYCQIDLIILTFFKTEVSNGPHAVRLMYLWDSHSS